MKPCQYHNQVILLIWVLVVLALLLKGNNHSEVVHKKLKAQEAKIQIKIYPQYLIEAEFNK